MRHFLALLGLQAEDQVIILEFVNSPQDAIIAGEQVDAPRALGWVEPVSRNPLLAVDGIDDGHLTIGNGEDSVPGKPRLDQPRSKILTLVADRQELPRAGEHLMSTLKLGIRRFPAIVAGRQGAEQNRQ